MEKSHILPGETAISHLGQKENHRLKSVSNEGICDRSQESSTKKAGFPTFEAKPTSFLPIHQGYYPPKTNGYHLKNDGWEDYFPNLGGGFNPFEKY